MRPLLFLCTGCGQVRGISRVWAGHNRRVLRKVSRKGVQHAVPLNAARI